MKSTGEENHGDNPCAVPCPHLTLDGLSEPRELLFSNKFLSCYFQRHADVTSLACLALTGKLPFGFCCPPGNGPFPPLGIIPVPEPRNCGQGSLWGKLLPFTVLRHTLSQRSGVDEILLRIHRVNQKLCTSICRPVLQAVDLLF